MENNQLIFKNKQNYQIVMYGGDSIDDILDIVSQLSDMIQIIIQALKVVGGQIGTIASFGFAGDTVVEIGVLAFDVLLVLNDIRRILKLFDPKKHPGSYKIVTKMLSVKFYGVKSTKMKYKIIQNDIKQTLRDPNELQHFYETLCQPLQSLLNKIGAIVGDAISAGIPDDGFIASTAIQGILQVAIQKGIPFTMSQLEKYYYKLPPDFLETLRDHKKLGDLIEKVFKKLKTVSKFLKAPLYVYPGYWAKRIAFGRDPDEFLMDMIIKNKYLIARMINKSLALLIFILHFMDEVCLKM